MRIPALILIATGLCSAQIEPKAGQWKTWVIPNGSALRLPAPPSTDATSPELQQVKQTARDQAALDAIRYWDAGSPGYRWMQVAAQAVISAGLPTPMQTRALALVAAAISDGTIAAWDSKYTYNRKHPSEVDSSITTVIPVPQNPSYPSEHAVAAGAAAAVLGYVVPAQAAAFNDMATQAAKSRVAAGVAFPSDVSAGLDLGRSVAQMVIAYAKMDGSDQTFSGSFPQSTGVWGSPNPVTPLAGSWRPWVLNGAADFRPPAPPAFGSDDAKAQYAAVKNLTRTNATNHLAWFWQPSFFQPWLQQVDLEIFQNHLDSNAPRAARAYAYQAIAQHDATLACWDAKFTYLEPRPPQADSTIVPFFALPQHPGYPSGHACGSAASAAVLSFLFPSDAQLLAAMANDGGISTFDAGIHTQLDVTQGSALGTRVGQKAADRAKSDGAN